MTVLTPIFISGDLLLADVWTEDSSFLDNLSTVEDAFPVGLGHGALLDLEVKLLQGGESWRMQLAAVVLLVYFGLWAVTKIPWAPSFQARCVTNILF